MFDNIGLRVSIANPDVQISVSNKPTGETYLDYILCYIDNILFVIHDIRQKMGDIQKNVNFKNNKIEEPDFYLGASLKKKELNSQTPWKMPSQEYIKIAIKKLGLS